MKILLVEDEIIIANALKQQLYSIGYHDILHADDAYSALKIFEVSTPDLVIMDIALKGSNQDGISLSSQLLAKESIPIIFLSSYSDQRTIERIKEIRHANYLVKPCSTRQLFVSIDIAITTFISENQKEENSNLSHPPCPLYSRTDHFFIKKNSHGYVKVNIQEFLWAESVRGGIEIYTETDKLMLTANMSSFINQFPHPDLVRVHRSFTINRSKVTTIGERELRLTFGNTSKSIPCSKTYWTKVKNEFLKLKSD